MTFVEAVNRVLRSNGRLGADDDDVTFNDTAHLSTITLARIAIQDEINDLVSDNLIPYEVTTGTITTSDSSAIYTLPTDFVRFYGKQAHIYNSTGNRNLFEYPGGMDQLSLSLPRYAVEKGDPQSWYFYPTTTKRIGFWQVPNGVYVYTFQYEKSVAVTGSTDTLPFHTEPEAQTFCQAAGRRFKALIEESSDVDKFVLSDPSYTTARARLFSLVKGRNPYSMYGSRLR